MALPQIVDPYLILGGFPKARAALVASGHRLVVALFLRAGLVKGSVAPLHLPLLPLLSLVQVFQHLHQSQLPCGVQVPQARAGFQADTAWTTFRRRWNRRRQLR